MNVISHDLSIAFSGATQAGNSADGREVDQKYNSTLNCLPFVNITQYDHLRGIINRFSLQLHPEPEVAMIFRKKGAKGGAGEIKLAQLETRLSENKEKVSSGKMREKLATRLREGLPSQRQHTIASTLILQGTVDASVYTVVKLGLVISSMFYNLHACSDDSDYACFSLHNDSLKKTIRTLKCKWVTPIRQGMQFSFGSQFIRSTR